MKINLIFIFLLISISSYLRVEGQAIIAPLSSQKICYAGNKVNRIYIPPPARSYRAKGSKGATIKVSYIGFPDGARTAMEFAITVLAAQLSSDVTINVYAQWLQMTEPGILASSGVTSYYKGSAFNAFNPFAYYPVTLAEKIAEEDLNTSGEPDIQIQFNSKINWYTGTDGTTPTDKYDLVTVVLHEMCHGLGFNDSMNTNDTIGWYGFSSIPVVYDYFIENSSGIKLVDSTHFSNYSVELYTQLTGNQLYFQGPLLSNYASGQGALLYAPSKWAGGSSISHLNDKVPLLNNALMTPFIDKGEAIHDPGKVTMSILGDVGWITTRLYHNKFSDTEQSINHLDFNVKIKSDSLFDKNMVGLVYSTDNFVSFDTLLMTYNQVIDTFSVALNIPAYNTRISYYLFARDCFMRVFKLPSEGSSLPYTFFVGADTVKPLLTHTPLDYFFERIDTINFSAEASDNIGIDSVYLEYKVNTGGLKHVKLDHDSLFRYSNFVTFPKGSLNGGDSISYRIIAVDKANQPNNRILPSAGYYVIHIEDIGSVYDSYITDFSSGHDDFVNRGFSITQPANFSSPALHTKHPYESPEKVDKTLEYTSVINHPVIVDKTGMMITYKEVVLVEPGDPGSYFGSPDFFDYVIVEASKNFGKSWFWLEPGYDCRITSFFETTYTRSYIGMNSTAVGKENMYALHTLDLRSSPKLSKGDSIMLRFRLFSDPFAHGWGWAIEDFSFRSIASDVEKISLNNLSLYPNPGSGRFTLDTRQFDPGEKMKLTILNPAGIILKEIQIDPGTENMIDISGWPPGIYILVIYDRIKVRTIKYVLTGN